MTQNDAHYLGALLHDIGKFAWRAQELKQGDNHEKLGEEFIREHLGKCKVVTFFTDDIIDAMNRRVGNIWYSDIMTAQEREQQESTQTRRLLLSIFNRISIGKAERPATVHYYMPQKESLQIQMPEELPGVQNVAEWKPEPQDAIRWHKELWDKFLTDLVKLRGIEDFTTFLKTFHSLLEEYTTTICSAGYKTYPDITLYDHSRITAALSVCNKGECVMIKGDVSGIQNFIYSQIQDVEKPAKTLRGRSIFITMLVDTIADYCLEQLGLYPANLLFNSGGHFQIVAPKTDSILQTMIDIERKINNVLLKRFGGKLSLLFASTTCSLESLIKEYDSVIQQLNENLEEAKKKKLLSISDTVLLMPLDESINNEKTLNEMVLKIGERLPLSSHMLEIHYTNEEVKTNNAIIDFKEFSRAWIIIEEKELKSDNVLGNLRKQDIRYAILHALKDENFLSYSHKISGLDYPLGFTRKYLGIHIPMQDDNRNSPMEFEDIAKINSENYPLLGVLRMDVDSLGAIFAIGLHEENNYERLFTISRFVSLSRELTKFFTVHINTLARKYKIYLVYSGGDDLFAVGSWVSILSFAQELRKDFDTFVCGNNNITISAGIVFTKESFPISNSALWAGKQEEKAKQASPFTKDFASVFYREVSWKELEELLNVGDTLLRIIGDREEHGENKNTLPRSFIHQMLTQTKECFDNKGRMNIEKIYRFNSWLHYTFARRDVTAEIVARTETTSFNSNETIKIWFAKQMMEGNKKENSNFYKNFIIPASYVLLKTRRISQK